MKTIKKIGIITVLILIAVLVFLFSANYSDGTRSGVVIKISKKGVIFKTYEGQLNLSSFGALKNSNQLAETFHFSVDKSQEELVKTLEEVALSGERVNLHYKEKYMAMPWKGDTKIFVYEIERSQNTDQDQQDRSFP